MLFQILVLFIRFIVVGVISVVAYFVIKKAVKDALNEYYDETNK